MRPQAEAAAAVAFRVSSGVFTQTLDPLDEGCVTCDVCSMILFFFFFFLFVLVFLLTVPHDDDEARWIPQGFKPFPYSYISHALL